MRFRVTVNGVGVREVRVSVYEVLAKTGEVKLLEGSWVSDIRVDVLMTLGLVLVRLVLMLLRLVLVS